MTDQHDHSRYRNYRKDYNLKIVGGEWVQGKPFVIEAEPVPGSQKAWHEPPSLDAQFDLSSMIGNDNGKFKWGREGFHKTGKGFRLELDDDTGAFLLCGTLADLAGNNYESTINIDDQLTIKDYIDQGDMKTYHRLVQRDYLLDKRSLILCFDGTSNKFGHKNTNVVKLIELFKKDDPALQMVYYQTGVGTYAPPGLMTSIGLTVAEKADEAAAWYLYQHVIDGYKYLMQTYRVGDSISIFGFSRGAFTARALAGMLHCVGLLPSHNAEQVPFAYEVYKNSKDIYHPDYNKKSAYDGPDQVDPREFRDTFSAEVHIDFVGVWDTVASVGAIWPQTLPWIDYNPSIRTFRQALALDERRGNFIPSVWDHRYTKDPQNVREVWFRGEHSNIGGGAPSRYENGKPVYEDRMLSNIPLRWMVRQIIDCRVGILFDICAVRKYRNLHILERPNANYATGQVWVDRIQKSIELDKEDVKLVKYDSIGWNLLWNLLEYLPVAKPTKTDKFEPTTTRRINAKSGRSIFRTSQNDPIYLHSSVIDYLMTDPTYNPLAKWYGYGEFEWPRVEEAHIDWAMDENGFPHAIRDRFDIVRPKPSPTSKTWRGYFFTSKPSSH